LAAHSKRVRISYVIGSLDIGGAETQLVRLVNKLDRSRFEPSIITMWQRGPLEGMLAPDVPFELAFESTRAERRGRSRLIFGAQLLTALGRAIRRQHADVVHAYLPAAYVLCALAAWGLRVPLIVAGRRGLAPMDLYGPVRWRFLAGLANRVIDLHVCNSNAVRQSAIVNEGVSAARLRVVYNGIDLPSLDGPAPSPEWRSEGGLAVMVANLIRYKGHREVLQALAKVAQRHPSFRLVLMGDGPERADLQSRARELGLADNVIFAGRRLGAAEQLQNFDFSILGSSQEGFPNALMESMACAVPVVATAVGGVPELVEDSTHGRLVPFGDVDAMANAICWMIEHPDERRQMGMQARRRIADDFSTSKMVEATESVYQEFLGRRPNHVKEPVAG
jgi:glycosyltransferase involved in cell wall biosynthesis